MTGTQKPLQEQSHESLGSQAAQVGLPFLAAGAGMVLAGTVLDRVQVWEVFTETRELFILVPGGKNTSTCTLISI